MSPTSHTALPHILANLRKDSTASVIASAELPELNARLYVPDVIDERLEAWVREPGAARLFVLTGSAGHGKSAAIARVLAVAKSVGRTVQVRYDATHSDTPKETYREGLETFLAPFEDSREPPEELHLLAMNLGIALDFFTGDGVLPRWSGLARTIDDHFRLGLETTSPPRKDVVIVDLSTRFELTMRQGIPHVDFLDKLLKRFDASDPTTPVGEAIANECNGCPRRHDCPVLLNTTLLSAPNVRHNIAHALTAGSIKGKAHLTPRNLLDFVSLITLPTTLAARATGDQSACSLRISDAPLFSNDDKWGRRLEDTLTALAFPRDADHGGDVPSRAELQHVMKALALEDPAGVRSAAWDAHILEWAADPHTLFKQLPFALREYLEKPPESLGPQGYADMIRLLRWVGETPETRPDTRRFNTFVSLCLGDSVLRREWESQIAIAFERIAARAYHDDPAGGQQHRIALQLGAAASKYEVLADLFELRSGITDASFGSSANHASFLVRIYKKGATEGAQFVVDWATFDLLCDVSEGYAPPSFDGSHTLFLHEVAKRLLGSSGQDQFLIVREKGEPSELQLEGKSIGKRRKINVSVKR